MNEVDISVTEVEPPHWLSLLESFCLKALDALHVDNSEVSILLCNDGFIRDLNARFRGRDEPTDVLSFDQGFDSDDIPLPETAGTVHVAGDIVISLDTLYRNAEEFSITPQEELKRLVVHGLLHLQGMDHADNSPDQEMLIFQEHILQAFTEDTLF